MRRSRRQFLHSLGLATSLVPLTRMFPASHTASRTKSLRRTVVNGDDLEIGVALIGAGGMGTVDMKTVLTVPVVRIAEVRSLCSAAHEGIGNLGWGSLRHSGLQGDPQKA